jgi:hypothetical protein
MRKCSDSRAVEPMNTLSMSKKRWAIVLQAAGVLAALAVVIGVAIVAGSAAPRAAHQQSHTVATAMAAPRPHHDPAFSLPVSVDLTAALAFVGCLLALSGWGAWQRRNRCRDCGYAPVFCQCELAGSKH